MNSVALIKPHCWSVSKVPSIGSGSLRVTIIPKTNSKSADQNLLNPFTIGQSACEPVPPSVINQVCRNVRNPTPLAHTSTFKSVKHVVVALLETHFPMCNSHIICSCQNATLRELGFATVLIWDKTRSAPHWDPSPYKDYTLRWKRRLNSTRAVPWDNVPKIRFTRLSLCHRGTPRWSCEPFIVTIMMTIWSLQRLLLSWAKIRKKEVICLKFLLQSAKGVENDKLHPMWLGVTCEWSNRGKWSFKWAIRKLDFVKDIL